MKTTIYIHRTTSRQAYNSDNYITWDLGERDWGKITSIGVSHQWEAIAWCEDNLDEYELIAGDNYYLWIRHDDGTETNFRPWDIIKTNVEEKEVVESEEVTEEEKTITVISYIHTPSNCDVKYEVSNYSVDSEKFEKINNQDDVDLFSSEEYEETETIEMERWVDYEWESIPTDEEKESFCNEYLTFSLWDKVIFA